VFGTQRRGKHNIKRNATTVFREPSSLIINTAIIMQKEEKNLNVLQNTCGALKERGLQVQNSLLIIIKNAASGFNFCASL